MYDEEVLRVIEGVMRVSYTEEQKTFIAAMAEGKSVSSMSCPGVGKTTTILGGILMRQLLASRAKKRESKQLYTLGGGYIPQYSAEEKELMRPMYSCAFGKEAARSIEAKYLRCCKALGISPCVEFSTVHSLCNKILIQQWPAVNLVNNIMESSTLREALEQAMALAGIQLKQGNEGGRQLWQLSDLINLLNTRFCYSRESVENNYEFIKSGYSYEQVNAIRKHMVSVERLTRTVCLGDLPIWALQGLMSDSVLLANWRSQNIYMIVDEFQDLSPVDLYVVSYLATSIVAVGDINQQIYQFAGASPEIVDYFHEAFKDCVEAPLTQSQRCPKAVTDLANRVIAPTSEIHMLPRNAEGSVEFRNTPANWDSLAQEILDSGFYGFYAILYRNNISSIPVAEALFRKGIGVRGKYISPQDIPGIGSILRFCALALTPMDTTLVDPIAPLIKSKDSKVPDLKKVMSQRNLTFHDAMQFCELDRDQTEILNATWGLRVVYERGGSIGDMVKEFLPTYESKILNVRYRDANRVRMPIDNQLTFFGPLLGKGPVQFFDEESAKRAAFEYGNAQQAGVMLFTIHAMKGGEAKHVYLLDLDATVCPNDALLNRAFKDNATQYILRELQSERRLVYTAITRSSESLVICSNRLTDLIGSPSDNKFTKFEREHEFVTSVEDWDGFAKFYNLKAAKFSGSASQSSVLNAYMKG